MRMSVFSKPPTPDEVCGNCKEHFYTETGLARHLRDGCKGRSCDRCFVLQAEVIALQATIDHLLDLLPEKAQVA